MSSFEFSIEIQKSVLVDADNIEQAKQKVEDCYGHEEFSIVEAREVCGKDLERSKWWADEELS